MKHPFDRTDRIASLKIIAIYALFAALWIYLSDEVLGMLIRDTDTLVWISVFKGFLFIVVTAAILYQLISRYLRKTREIEQDLHASRNLINALLEGTTDAIFVKDLQGRYLLFNTAAANVTGKYVAELIGHDDTFLFSPMEAGAIMAGDRRVIDAGQVMTYEDYFTASDGTYRTFLSTKGPIFDAEGKVNGLFGISRDITERIQAEQRLRLSMEKYQAIIEAFDGLILIISDDYRIEFTNGKMINRTGENPVGEFCYKVLQGLDSVCPWCVNERVFAGETEHWEIQSPKDGRWYYMIDSLIHNPDGSMSKQSMITDITERKMQEEALHKSDEQWRALTEDSPDSISRYDCNGRRIYVNPAFEKMVGKTATTLIGKIPVEDPGRGDAVAAKVYQALKEVLSSGKSTDIDAAWDNNDGTTRHHQVRFVPEFDRNGAVIGVLSFGRDITTLKEIEKNLRESEQRFRDVFENVSDALYLLEVTENGRFRILEINPAMARSIGKGREEMIGRYLDEAVSGESYHVILPRYRHCVEAGTVMDEVIELDLPSGRRYFHSTFIPIRKNSGRIHRIVGISRDITDRKLAEELQLKKMELEARLERLAEISPGVVITFQLLPDGGTRIIYASPRVEDLTGFRPGDLAENASINLTKIHKDDVETFLQSIAESAATMLPWRHEFRIHNPIKGEIWVEGHTMPERQPDGSILWYGFIQDITARKRHQTQEEIRLQIFEQLARGGDLTEILGLVIKYVELANPDFIGNIMLADAEGKYLHPVCSSGLPDDYLDAIKKVKVGEGIGSCGTAMWRGETVIAEDLRTHPFWVQYNRPALEAGLLSCWSEPIFGASGIVLGTISIYQRWPGSPTREEIDLVRRACHLAAIAIERNRFIELLHRRGQEFRAMVENSPDTISRYDAQCRLIYVNPAMQTVFGLPESEILGKTPIDLSHLSEPAAFMKIVRDVWDKGFEIDKEMTYRNTKGEIRCLDIRAVPELGADGRVVSVLAIGRDIHLVKEAERQLRLLVENLPDFIVRLDRKLCFTYVSPSILRLYQVTRKAFLGKPLVGPGVWDSPGQKGALYQAAHRTLLKGEMVTLEDRWLGRFDIEIRFIPERDESGNIFGVMGIGRDITPERKLEQELFRAKKMEVIGQLAGGVAHEVRNPLNAILSISEALFREKEIANNAEYLPYIQHIRAQIGRLSKLMTDLLDLGKPISLANIHPVSLHEACATTIELWNMTDLSQTHPVIFTCDNSLPDLHVNADIARFQQALTNLIENAAQHSPEASEICLDIAEPAGRRVTIQVKDRGRGIAPGKIGKVFDPFFTTRAGGTGLGLPLVKHFVENMGGEVRIRNNDPPPGCTAELVLNIAGPGGEDFHETENTFD